jgi:hypothetical protein
MYPIHGILLFVLIFVQVLTDYFINGEIRRYSNNRKISSLHGKNRNKLLNFGINIGNYPMHTVRYCMRALFIFVKFLTKIWSILGGHN